MNTTPNTLHPIPQAEAFPGFVPLFREREQVNAEYRAAQLSSQIASAGPNVTRAAAYIEQHSPLFSGTDAHPQTRLFNDPTAAH